MHLSALFHTFPPAELSRENSRPLITQSDCCYVNQSVKILKSCDCCAVAFCVAVKWVDGWSRFFSPSITGVSKKSLGKDVAMALSLEWVKTLG